MVWHVVKNRRQRVLIATLFVLIAATIRSRLIDVVAKGYVPRPSLGEFAAGMPSPWK